MITIGDEVIVRRHRKRRRKNSRKLIIIASSCLLFVITAGYAAFSTNINITAKGNVLEKSRVIQSWNNTSNEDFHTDYYRENIVSATFLDTNEVPEEATESWNVSEDKEHGGVIAWVVPNEEYNTKYDLYIGANDGVMANEDSSYLFYHFFGLKNINFDNNFDTSNVINMRAMFNHCIELSVLDLTTFNTQNVTNMAYMFDSGDETKPMKLETIMFGENFKTNNVVNMAGMFGNCNYLKNLDVSNFDTSNVTNMYDMFAFCHSLTSLDVSGFDTSKVTNMHGMFFSLRSITSLNLCSFDTFNVKDMGSMLAGSPNLDGIKVGPNWTTAQADTTNMFTGSGVSSVTTGECESISN